ncbi:restriction endonuclease subunit S [uncultured Gilliamella sp.]|uniref:restriction endonuclease subunit S n=1 Tax=uncultured Gilliamella sp. TaxID=1193505 RepID=UPI0025DD1AD2|nr:restriction endonuclease subunit S [uncultured Gilliamella sp.]
MKNKNWNTSLAEKYCLSVRDGTHDSPKFVDYGYALITSKNIKTGSIDKSSAKLISESDYYAINKRSKVEQWDVLISMIGTVGDICIIEDENPDFAIKNIGLFKCKNEIESRWLYYWLKSPSAKEYINSHLNGTSQQYISLNNLRKLPISYPKDISIKQKIIDVMLAYDEVIRSKQRYIVLLEESARLLYQEWFVKFRFPEFRNCNLKNLIPEKWSMKKLSEICIVNRSNVDKKNILESIKYIDISSVNEGNISQVTEIPFLDAPGRARRVVQHGDILWSCVRPNRRSYTLLWQPDDNMIASTGFAVLTAKDIPFSYLYFATTSDDFVSYLSNRATGAAYPAVTGKDFEDATILCPTEKILNKFDEICLPILEQKYNLSYQNSLLTKARDELLPKLISGQIKV